MAATVLIRWGLRTVPRGPPVVRSRHDDRGHLRPALRRGPRRVRAQLRRARRGRRVGVRHRRRRDGRRPVGRHRRPASAGLGPGHHRPRLVGHQGRDRAVRAHPGRARSARPRRAGDAPTGPSSARTARSRSSSGTCSATRPACRRCASRCRRALLRLGAHGRRAGRGGAVLAARHPPRLPRADLRLPGRRGGAPGQRAQPRHVLRRRGGRAARPGLLDRPARGARAPGRADHPRATARARATRCRASTSRRSPTRPRCTA